VTSLAADLHASIAESIGSVEEVVSIGGGCVSQTYRLVARGQRYFAKADRSALPGFFATEAFGLEELRTASTLLRIPEPLAHRDDPTGWSWLVLEWIEPGAIGPGYWERLGAGLAEMHRRVTNRWGWSRDGFIGSLPQSNESASTWSEFWYSRRIEPQMERALPTSAIGRRSEWERLASICRERLEIAEGEGASTLHGDLWSGNSMPSDGGPALVDPAHYRGHREVDLAMMALFGGFDRVCFDAYQAAWPLEPGFELRRAIYQLYYLLVHVNLFGSSYGPRTVAKLRQVLAEA
jgi:protein-ribulosamine 3-kinase